MNYKFYFIVILVISIILFLIYTNKETFTTQVVNTDDNIYEIYEGNKIKASINTPGGGTYKMERNPLNPEKKFKMLKMEEEYTFTYNRDPDKFSEPLTFALYLKPDKTKSEFENFIEFISDTLQLKLSLSKKDSFYELKLTLNDDKIGEVINSVVVYSDQIEGLFFLAVIINYDQKYVDVYFNGKNVRLSYSDSIDFKTKKIEISNYIGYLGKILIWDSLLNMNSDLCKRFDCKLNCFILNGDSHNNDVNECINACYNSCKTDDNEVESLKKCQEMCIDCKMPGQKEEWSKEEKIKNCPWYSEIKLLDKSVPDAPKIRGFAGDGKITVEWLKPYDGRLKILRYVILVYETFNKERGAIINISNDPKCKICEHIITNLKNQVHYDVIVQSVNSLGISEKSNTITVVPNGSDIQDEIQNMFNEFDRDLDAKLKNKLIDDCDKKSFNNNENYILDEIEDEIDIEKVVKDKKSENLYRPKIK